MRQVLKREVGRRERDSDVKCMETGEVVCGLIQPKTRTQEKKQVDPSREECGEEGREELQGGDRGGWARVTESQTTWVYRKRWMVQRFSTAKKMKGKKSIPDIISLILLVTTCTAVVTYNGRTIKEKMA